jgi:hypothetical protein
MLKHSNVHVLFICQGRHFPHSSAILRGTGGRSRVGSYAAKNLSTAFRAAAAAARACAIRRHPVHDTDGMCKLCKLRPQNFSRCPALGIPAACTCLTGHGRAGTVAAQRKSPSPFGPGLCGVGGEGGGDADHRGGVRAKRRPLHRVPKKIDGGQRNGLRINEAPRNAYRGASPTAAVAGDYLPSPTRFLSQISVSGKPLRWKPLLFPCGPAARFVNHIYWLDSGSAACQSPGRRKKIGVSRTAEIAANRSVLDWGELIEAC